MIKKYNTLSFVWGIPGILIQIFGIMLRRFAQTQDMPPLYDDLGRLVVLFGIIALLIGFVYYAKAKGRSAWWCLFGFLSLIGLIVLACLKDKTLAGENVATGETNTRPASNRTFTILVILLAVLVVAAILAFVLLPVIMQAGSEAARRTNTINNRRWTNTRSSTLSLPCPYIGEYRQLWQPARLRSSSENAVGHN
jgi:hypothetical protein